MLDLCILYFYDFSFLFFLFLLISIFNSLLAQGRNEDAGCLMSTFSSLDSLRLALQFTSHLDPQRVSLLRTRYGTQLQAANQWEAARSFYSDHHMHAHTLIASVEQALAESSSAMDGEVEMGEISEDQTKDFVSPSSEQSNVLLRVVTESTFFKRIWRLCEGIDVMNTSDALLKETEKIEVQRTTEQVY